MIDATDLILLAQKKVRSLLRHRERFLRAWMLKTGVMDPREAVMCTHDTVNYSSFGDDGPAIITRVWFEHKPELRTQVQAVVDDMRRELREDGTLDGGCHPLLLTEYVTKLEAALKP